VTSSWSFILQLYCLLLGGWGW